MTRLTILCLGLSLSFLSLGVWPCVANQGAPDEQAEPAEVDPLAIYHPYIGRWRSTVHGNATDTTPEPYEAIGDWEARLTQDGKCVEFRGTAGPEGNEYTYLWIYTYDLRESRYVAWYHDGQGVNAKLYGTWSPARKEMVWTLADPDGWDVTPTFTDRLSDEDQFAFEFRLTAKDGTLIFDERGTAERLDDDEDQE